MLTLHPCESCSPSTHVIRAHPPPRRSVLTLRSSSLTLRLGGTALQRPQPPHHESARARAVGAGLQVRGRGRHWRAVRHLKLSSRPFSCLHSDSWSGWAEPPITTVLLSLRSCCSSLGPACRVLFPRCVLNFDPPPPPLVVVLSDSTPHLDVVLSVPDLSMRCCVRLLGTTLLYTAAIFIWRAVLSYKCSSPF